MRNKHSYAKNEAISLNPGEIAMYYRNRAPDLHQTGSAEWRGLCPIHGGDGPNFSVKRDSGLWHCHSQCQRGGDIFLLEGELSGLTDFPSRKRSVFEIIGRVIPTEEDGNRVRGGKTGERPWRQTAEYIYHNRDGDLVSRVARKERGSGSNREKQFSQSRWDGGRWISGVTGVRLVPYRLPELIETHPGTIVFICEGEKDCERLVAEGFAATTNPGGSGRSNLYRDWFEYFEGRRLIILPDNDEPGRRHAETVARLLFEVAAEIRILSLPGLPPKGDVSDWLDDGGTAEELRRLAGEVPALTDTSALAEVSEKEAVDRSPFRLKENGVFWLKSNGDEGFEEVWLSDRLEVVAATHDNGSNSGRLLRWRHPSGRMHEWAMPMALLAGDPKAIWARLYDCGLAMSPNRKAREKLLEYLQGQPTQRTVTCSSRIGWREGGFVLPDFSAGASEFVFQAMMGRPTSAWNVAGTAAQWRDNVGNLCVGNSRLILSVSAAFSGPLLHLTQSYGGGFHFFGSTSCGKTTALIVGSSVCGGGGGNGFLASWRSTVNGLEALALEHNDSTLFLDEISQLDGRQVADAAYLLSNGFTKNRMDKTLALRPVEECRLIFVSSGELTLAEHASAAGGKSSGGVEVRVVNIAADAGCGMGMFEDLHGQPNAATLADELSQRAREFYGAPFREFIEQLVAAKQAAKELFAQYQELAKEWVPTGAGGEVIRVAARFAIVATGGELATRWGLTGWRSGTALAAAEQCFRGWLRERGTVGSSDADAGVRAVRQFIEQHGASRFQLFGSQPSEDGCQADRSEQPIPMRSGFKRTIDGRTEYLFLPEAFKSEVLKGFNPKTVLEELAARGYLQHDPNRFTVKRRLPGLSSSRVYAVRESILGESEVD